MESGSGQGETYPWNLRDVHIRLQYQRCPQIGQGCVGRWLILPVLKGKRLVSSRRTYAEARRVSPLGSGCLGTRRHQQLSEAFLLSTGRTTPEVAKVMRSPINVGNLTRENTYLCLINVVVISFIGTTNEHDNEIFSIIYGVIANWGLEEVPVLFEPLGDVDWW